MTSSEPCNIKRLIRFAMENADGTEPTSMDPERVNFLRDALASASVNLTEQMKGDIQLIQSYLQTLSGQEDDVFEAFEDLLSLTEDIDLANDFFKLGGMELINCLFSKGPGFLKSGTYELVAHITQNNPSAQELCLNEQTLTKLLQLLSTENKLSDLKKILLAISCLTRNYAPGLTAFNQLYGFDDVLNNMCVLLDKADVYEYPEIERLFAKSAFLMFCLLQEGLPSNININEEYAEKVAKLTMRLKNAQEHLLGILLLLLSGSSSIDAAINTENLSDQSHTVRHSLSIDTSNDFIHWLELEDEKLSKLNDAAHAETLSYIAALRSLLTN